MTRLSQTVGALILLLLGGCAATPGTGSSNWDEQVPAPPDVLGQVAPRSAAPGESPALPRAAPAQTARTHVAIYPDAPLAPIEPAQVAARVVVALSPPADLWERIRRGYGMPNLESDLVREREQWYGTRPEDLQRMTERSRKYLFHIVEELERRNMPTELALLPFIESAFNPQAVSSAKAAGMFKSR